MQTQDLTVIRNFFSEDEWSAIESALNDYADYGDEECDLVDNIQSKIYQLFKVWLTLKSHTVTNTLLWTLPRWVTWILQLLKHKVR